MGFFVEVEPAVKLYVQDINPSGDHTIVFLHGWPLSSKQFEYQFDVLPRFGVRCIGIDWRGFGKSDKPFTGYNLARLSDDMAVVMNTLALKQYILLGHSTGAAIATQYMTRHQPKEAKGLVLLDAAVPTGIELETANQYIDMTLNDRPHMLQQLTDQFFFQYATEPLKQWFFSLGLEASGWSTAAVMKMLSEFDLTAQLSDIHIPVLIIHGIHDRVVPFSQAEMLHKLLPASQLVALANSGHGAFWEERDKVNDSLIKWLGL